MKKLEEAEEAEVHTRKLEEAEEAEVHTRKLEEAEEADTGNQKAHRDISPAMLSINLDYTIYFPPIFLQPLI